MKIRHKIDVCAMFVVVKYSCYTASIQLYKTVR